MPTTRSDKVKAFTEDGEKIGLKKETITKLCGQDVDTVDILRLCSSADIEDFQLSKGQSLVLQQWIRQLNDDTASMSDPSQASQMGDVTLHALLGEMEEPTPEAKRSNNTLSTGKPLLVIDHINSMVSGVSDVSEHQVYSQGGNQLVF